MFVEGIYVRKTSDIPQHKKCTETYISAKPMRRGQDDDEEVFFPYTLEKNELPVAVEMQRPKRKQNLSESPASKKPKLEPVDKNTSSLDSVKAFRFVGKTTESKHRPGQTIVISPAHVVQGNPNPRGVREKKRLSFDGKQGKMKADDESEKIIKDLIENIGEVKENQQQMEGNGESKQSTQVLKDKSPGVKEEGIEERIADVLMSTEDNNNANSDKSAQKSMEERSQNAHTEETPTENAPKQNTLTDDTPTETALDNAVTEKRPTEIKSTENAEPEQTGTEQTLTELKLKEQSPVKPTLTEQK